MKSIIERFQEKYIPVPESGCWLWTHSVDRWGYGRFGSSGKTIGAHRMSWALFRGETNGLLVLHKCDTPSCVNPDHLRLGTWRQNMVEMVERGRNRNLKHRGMPLLSKHRKKPRNTLRSLPGSPPLTKAFGDSPSLKAPAAATFLDLCDDREPDLPCGYTAPTHYLEF